MTTTASSCPPVSTATCRLRPLIFLPPPAHGYTLAAALSLPRSRGRLRLAGPDVATQPLIDPAYLADERDVETLVAGLRMAQRVGRTEPFARWRPTQLLPAPDGGWRKFVRRDASTQFHPVGTRAIGTVVDPSCGCAGCAVYGWPTPR